MSQCANCGTEMPKGAKFCSNCGTPAKDGAANFCPSCGAELKPDAKFCHACGQTTSGVPAVAETYTGETSPAAQSPAASTRSWGTILLPLLGIPALIGILFLLTYKQKNPAPMSQTQMGSAAPSEGGGQGMDMAAMESVTKQIGKYKSDLQANPQDTTALLALGSMYEIAGRFEEATDYFRRYLEIVPDNIPVRMSLAGAYYNNSKRQEAVAELQQVLQDNPNYDYAMFNLGVIYLAEGKKDDAIKWWHKVMEADPTGELGQKAREQIMAVGGK